MNSNVFGNINPVFCFVCCVCLWTTFQEGRYTIADNEVFIFTLLITANIYWEPTTERDYSQHHLHDPLLSSQPPWKRVNITIGNSIPQMSKLRHAEIKELLKAVWLQSQYSNHSAVNFPPSPGFHSQEKIPPLWNPPVFSWRLGNTNWFCACVIPYTYGNAYIFLL